MSQNPALRGAFEAGWRKRIVDLSEECLMPARDERVRSMSTQPILAKLALGGFLLGLVIALTACLGTRLGTWDYAEGVKILSPAWRWAARR